MRILLDMDGVVADFVTGILAHWGRPWPYYDNHGDAAWDLPGILGIEPKAFWEPLGYEFWAGLPKTPEADRLVDGLRRRCADVCFVSSPCQTPGCMEGKRDWVRNHFPEIPLLLAIRSKGGLPPKEFCAGPSSVLIDDCSANIDKYAPHGPAFLFPRPWNREWLYEPSALQLLDCFLDGVA